MKQQTTKQHAEFRDKLRLIVQQTILDKQLMALCTAGWGKICIGLLE